MVEQELIREGVSREEIRGSLRDVHLPMGEQLETGKTEVEAPHPVHTFTEEHKAILSYLDRLDTLSGKMEKASGFEEVSEDLSELGEVAEALIDTESHHRREEKALFPFLHSHGVQEPPQNGIESSLPD